MKQFVDDCACFLRDIPSLYTLFETIRFFFLLSRLNINAGKSVLFFSKPVEKQIYKFPWYGCWGRNDEYFRNLRKVPGSIPGISTMIRDRFNLDLLSFQSSLNNTFPFCFDLQNVIIIRALFYSSHFTLHFTLFENFLNLTKIFTEIKHS